MCASCLRRAGTTGVQVCPMGSVYCLLGALLGATLSGPFCSPASLATPEKPSVQMALAAGCEASPLLFSCFYRAVGRPKRQSCRVTTYGTCYEKISSERLNETVIFEGDRREQRRSMPTGPSWSNISKEAKEPRSQQVNQSEDKRYWTSYRGKCARSQLPECGF